MIIVSGHIAIEPDDTELAMSILGPLVDATREEAGCRTYGFYADPFAPGQYRLYEEWDDQAALDAHMASEHMAAMNARIGEVRVVDMAISFYDATPRDAG